MVFLLSAGALAQAPPPQCPADRPVDDIIAEIHKQQSKKANRNTNPIPEGICIFGLCVGTGKTPPTLPPPAPRAETAPAASAGSSGEGVSSSRTPADKCNDATERAVEAAHNVEVGDYYFQEKNYRAASLRYQDAAEGKPSDAAIHVRLGRAFEKLNDVPQAVKHYQTAEKLAGPEKWTQEARAALERLHRAQKE